MSSDARAAVTVLASPTELTNSDESRASALILLLDLALADCSLWNFPQASGRCQRAQQGFCAWDGAAAVASGHAESGKACSGGALRGGL